MSYYIIKSKMCEMVLDIEGNHGAGAHVFMYPQHGGDNQVWFDDPSTGTIKSKANKKCCLTFNGEQMCIKQYEPGNIQQQWMRQGQTIRNRVEPDNVLDIYRKNKEKGAKVGSYKYKGGENQHWEFIPVAGHADGVTSSYYQGQRKEFFIVSKMNGKVLDVSGEKTQPGAKLIMYDKHSTPQPNQLWYLDHLGLIRSALSDLAPSNKEKGHQLFTAMPTVDPRCQWFIQGDKIMSRAGEVMDISGQHKNNGAEVISFDSKEQTNQQWTIEYVN